MECTQYNEENKTCITYPQLGVLHDRDLCELCLEQGFLNLPDVAANFNYDKCKHMEDTGIKLSDRRCKCTYIICRNPDSPIKDAIRVWNTKKCNSRDCRFHDQE